MNRRWSGAKPTSRPAPHAAVFAFLTDPEKIIRWMGAEATAEAHTGGPTSHKASG
jgi:uncharacterized protein YndB with AHSA1/START domain